MQLHASEIVKEVTKPSSTKTTKYGTIYIILQKQENAATQLSEEKALISLLILN